MPAVQTKARLIAFYLPQFHPTPENDEWWGQGFTEWTNTAKAKPLFRGHYQPHIPADLGFYDLRVPETRIAQAEMARQYGIEAFCYYHYWFAGRRILERPFNEVLESGQPNFPFCLCWANETWTGIWHGDPKRILIKQTYPGLGDYQKHFDFLLKAFTDSRYVTVDGKPLFLIFRPQDIPELERMTEFWRNLAAKAGLKNLYLVGASWNPSLHSYTRCFDAFAVPKFPPIKARIWVSRRNPIKWLIKQCELRNGKPTIYSYKKITLDFLQNKFPNVENIPCVVPNWDNTPRSGRNGLVFHGSTPELFRIQLKKAISIIRDKPKEQKIIFAKSWNEWAEGNHLEPDLKFGKAYLEVIKEEVLGSGNT